MGKTLDREVADRELTQEQRELLWRYWPLARSRARQYVRNIASRNVAYTLQFHMTDWAIDWLFDCVRTYDPEIQPNFATYYLTYLSRYLHRNHCEYMEQLSLQKQVNFELVESWKPDDASRVDDILDSRQQLGRIYDQACINSDERDYLRGWAEEGSFNALAIKLNVKRQAVHVKVNRILNQIRQAIGEQ